MASPKSAQGRSSRSTAAVTRSFPHPLASGRPSSAARPGSGPARRFARPPRPGSGRGTRPRRRAPPAAAHRSRSPTTGVSLPKRLAGRQVEALPQRLLDHHPREQAAARRPRGCPDPRSSLGAARPRRRARSRTPPQPACQPVVSSSRGARPARAGPPAHRPGQSHGVDHPVAVVPAVQLQHLEAEGPVEVHAQRPHHAAGQVAPRSSRLRGSSGSMPGAAATSRVAQTGGEGASGTSIRRQRSPAPATGAAPPPPRADTSR